MGIFRTSSQGDGISSDPERNVPRGGGRCQIIQKFAIKGRQSEHQKYFCELKKTRYLRLRNLALFYVWGRCKSLGSLKSFLSYASQLPGASILCFLDPEFLSAHQREWLHPEVCLVAGIALLPQCP